MDTPNSVANGIHRGRAVGITRPEGNGETKGRRPWQEKCNLRSRKGFHIASSEDRSSGARRPAREIPAAIPGNPGLISEAGYTISAFHRERPAGTEAHQSDRLWELRKWSYPLSTAGMTPRVCLLYKQPLWFGVYAWVLPPILCDNYIRHPVKKHVQSETNET